MSLSFVFVVCPFGLMMLFCVFVFVVGFVFVSIVIASCVVCLVGLMLRLCVFVIVCCWCCVCLFYCLYRLLLMCVCLC